METTNAIHNWRSIRRFKAEPVAGGALRAVLEAGCRAPSWENVQPWRFVVVEDAAMKEKLVLLSHGQKFINKAPAVICVCGDVSAWDKPKNRESLMELINAGVMRATEEIVDNFILKDPMYFVGSHGPSVILSRTFEQLGIALGFMCVETVNQGLGACIVGAFGNEVTGGEKKLYEEVKSDLGLSESTYLLSMLVIGIPDEAPVARPRKNFDLIVSRGRVGQKF